MIDSSLLTPEEIELVTLRVHEQIHTLTDDGLLQVFTIVQQSENWQKRTPAACLCMNIVLDERLRRRALEWAAEDAKE